MSFQEVQQIQQILSQRFPDEVVDIIIRKSACTTAVGQAVILLSDLLQNGSQRFYDSCDLEIILAFYKTCLDLGKRDDPPEPELFNPQDPDMVAKFTIPERALDVFRSMRATSYDQRSISYGNYDGQDVVDLDGCMRIANIADDLHLFLCMEAIGQIISKAICDKSPEEVQVMRGKEGIWTPEMEAEAIRQHPYLG